MEQTSEISCLNHLAAVKEVLAVEDDILCTALYIYGGHLNLRIWRISAILVFSSKCDYLCSIRLASEERAS